MLIISTCFLNKRIQQCWKQQAGPFDNFYSLGHIEATSTAENMGKILSVFLHNAVPYEILGLLIENLIKLANVEYSLRSQIPDYIADGAALDITGAMLTPFVYITLGVWNGAVFQAFCRSHNLMRWLIKMQDVIAKQSYVANRMYLEPIKNWNAQHYNLNPVHNLKLLCLRVWHSPLLGIFPGSKLLTIGFFTTPIFFFVTTCNGFWNWKILRKTKVLKNSVGKKIEIAAVLSHP